MKNLSLLFIIVMTFFLTTHSFAQQLAIEIPVCAAMDAETEGQEYLSDRDIQCQRQLKK